MNLSATAKRASGRSCHGSGGSRVTICSVRRSLFEGSSPSPGAGARFDSLYANPRPEDLKGAVEGQSTEASVALVPPVPCAGEVGRQELFPPQPRRAPMYREGATGTRARTPDAGAPPAIEIPRILGVDQALRLEPQHLGTRNACPKAPEAEALAWWIRQCRGSSRSRVSPSQSFGLHRPSTNRQRHTARSGRYHQ